jgi:putative oxidoreductase
VPSILFEVAAGLLVIVGYQTRIVALLLAGFSLLMAAILHSQLGEQMIMLLFRRRGDIYEARIIPSSTSATA